MVQNLSEAGLNPTQFRTPQSESAHHDATRLDVLITDVEARLDGYLDSILHHADFQKLESAWRGLAFLVDQTDFRALVKIEVLDISKDALRQDFEDATDVTQSGLFRQTYTLEY
ncbi:type VI secretion system contractile sheath domain-containing protein, partial [Caballeronia sp. BR00000012568055]|uniref:type VI secretion system contractile sheath domain-containing protein n=1 Tax=Caballeronia sp. BR00000012568055 TaxID=2918761 RepID=UPI0023F97AB2